jgi:tetratricopeptide (TPR) repeat protein/tRNA A-37 threonylcarbamoyl transferase component Bud32
MNRPPASPSDATLDPVEALPSALAEPAAATVDFATDGTAENAPVAVAQGTVDFAPPPPSAAPDQTLDHLPSTDGTADGTMDFAPGADAVTAAPVGTTGGTLDYRPQAPPPQSARPAQSSLGKKGKKSSAPESPQSVAGYDILSTLGRGAMGVVYKARQRGLNRLVALKMILSGDHAAAHELARFQGEAEAVARLHHPNIVQIYEVGEEQGRPYFSLEFVDGIALDKKANGTPLPPREAAVLVEKLAVAMEYAHQNGIIHRDLKPANVLLTQDGTPKVGDFGLAKRIDEDAGQTRTGTVLGTPSYMAPEQAEGRLKDVGPLSDQYSLGAILYELLTGRPPFKGATILDTLNQLRTMEPVPPVQFQPGVPRDLETIALKCLQKDPARRYASSEALAADLRRFLAGEPILARPVGVGERLWRWCKRNPRVAGLSAAVVGLVLFTVVSMAVFTVVFKEQKDRADTKAKEAIDQKGIAEQKQVEADTNAAEAIKQTGIAKQNEQRAKNTAKIAVTQMVGLGGNLHDQLQSRRLSQSSAPELRQLREQVMALLRQSLVIVGKAIGAAGTTTYGQEAVAVDLGDLLARLGQDQEAAKLYREAYESMKRHAEAEPDNDQTRANYGAIVMRLGDAAQNADGDLRGAVARYTEARDLHRDILDHPRGGQRKPVDSRIAIAHNDVRLGRAYLALGQPAEARKCFEEAVACRQAWIDEEPSALEARSWMTEAREWLGIACSHLGDEKGMREHLGAALHVNEGLVVIYPKELGYKGDLSEMQGAWGDALLLLGRPDEAEKSYEGSLKNLRLLLAANPDDMSREPLVALAYERLGAAAAAQGRADDARKHYREALQVREELHRLEPMNLPWHAAYAVALARAGKPADAAAEAAKVRPRAAKNTDLLMQVARSYAAGAAADTPQKADYVKGALAALGAVTEMDYQDVNTLRTDADFAAIRAEPGFRAIVGKVGSR